MSRQGLHCHLIDAAYDPEGYEIGPLLNEDFTSAAKLFFDTVHTINIHDYTQEQLDAWAPQWDECRARIVRKLSGQQTIGIKECGILIGFGSLDNEGNVNMLYVHKNRQSQGIGKIILMELERLASERGSRSLALFLRSPQDRFSKARDT